MPLDLGIGLLGQAPTRLRSHAQLLTTALDSTARAGCQHVFGPYELVLNYLGWTQAWHNATALRWPCRAPDLPVMTSMKLSMLCVDLCQKLTVSKHSNCILNYNTRAVHFRFPARWPFLGTFVTAVQVTATASFTALQAFRLHRNRLTTVKGC